jgi:uncharacterized protein (TIGR03545 family)
MRWKALVPTVVLLAAAVVFSVFFLDGFVECALERVGTSVNGAKVELGGVDIKLASLSVTLKDLQVTDKAAPMTNALQVDTLKFDVAAKPLTWKKVIIETGEVDGIRTGTPRKTSGALPPEEVEKDEAESEAAAAEEPSKAAEMAKEAAGFALTNLKEQYDPKKLIQPENLASYKKVQEEQARFTALSGEWEKKVDALQADGKVDQIKALVDRAKKDDFSGVEGLKKAKDYIDEAKKYKEEVKVLGKTVAEVKGSLTKEFAAAKDSLREIDRLKNADYESSLGQLKGGAFSAEGISRGLIGPEWFGKARNGLALFAKVRRMIPQKKAEAKPPPPPPRVGRDVHFPFKYAWPAFHWKNARISGLTSGDRAILYQGTLKDVTSDPKLVGKPIALDVTGKRTDGPEKLTLHAEFDYTTDVGREAVNLKYEGLALAGTKLGEVGGPVAIKSGAGLVTADVEVKGADLAGVIQFKAEPVALDHQVPAEQAKNKLLTIVHDVLAGINRLDAAVTVSNTVRSPKFDLKTTLDDQFKDAVSQVLKKELEELKAQFRARVDELVNEQRQKLASLIESKTGLAGNKLNSKENAVAAAQEQLDKLQDDLKKKGQQSLPIPGLSKPSGDSGGDSKPALPEFKNPFKKR